MNVIMVSTPLIEIDAAGMGRGRKRPSYKIPSVAQFTVSSRGQKKTRRSGGRAGTLLVSKPDGHSVRDDQSGCFVMSAVKYSR